MKLLSIECSGLVASVAIVEEDKILSEYTTNLKLNHSVTIMPMIAQMCENLALDMKSLDAIAVSAGPGSFTGLRIGSATAKGIAHGLNLPIASVPTLYALAHNIEKTDALIVPLMDARRQQVYSAVYAYSGDAIEPLTEMRSIEIDALLDEIVAMNRHVIFLGDGFEPNRSAIEAKMPEGSYHLASASHRFQRAGIVGLIGARFVSEGQVESYLEHTPIYLRKSQAEREYEEKQSAKE